MVGLGQTGLSVVRYLQKNGTAFAVVDSRTSPPGSETLQTEFPQVPYYFGAFTGAKAWFKQASCLIVSPGVAVATPEIQKAQQKGAEVIGDIELFVRAANAPIVAITGSNGKSSVTTLVTQMAQQAGLRAYACGNLGLAALDALAETPPDVYVMELSSFQLETTYSLRALAATVLNISEDHLDRYNSFEDYIAAKQTIYRHCECAVINRDDALVRPMQADLPQARLLSFGQEEPEAGQYGLRECNGQQWLARGSENILAVSSMRLAGTHNALNALAALALGEAIGLPQAAMVLAIQSFTGLPHRTQWLRLRQGVNWYNDSKGTNVGAAVAALQGLPGQTVLIAGGQSKDADFTPLAAAVRQGTRAVIVLGEDAEKIALVLEEAVAVQRADSMAQAVDLAATLAQPGDSVLLSPACASFDMFNNYIHRGEVFAELVGGLPE